MLCLKKPNTRRAPWLARRLAWALAGCLGTVMAAPDSASSPWDALKNQIDAWAVSQPAFQGRHVQVAPLDSRIAVQPCQQMLHFDQPFPSQPSVRVRCTQPQWQLFVTLGPPQDPLPVQQSNPTAPALYKVLVSNELLRRGTVVSPSMFSVANMPAAGMENQLVSESKVLVNMELVRDLPPNTPLKTYDLKNAVLIKRGQTVTVTASEGASYLITVKAEALQDGAFGESIRLKNTESSRSLSAEVTGPGTAKIR